MILIWLPLGLALPAVTGWSLLRLLEGPSPVLLRVERWVVGSVLGLTAGMFLQFLAQIALGVPFSMLGFALVQGLLAAATRSAAVMVARQSPTPHPSSVIYHPSSVIFHLSSLKSWQKILIGFLALWTLVRIAAGGLILLGTPPVYDDTLNNWNMRGKTFYATQALTLVLPSQKPGDGPSQLSAYPPTVPLAKAMLASMAGEWSEPLVNSLHLIWFLTLLAVVFLLLRRLTGSALWAGLGAYVLGSLPLELMHGTSAYADVFLSLHLATAVGFLLVASRATDRSEALAWLRLTALPLALLPLTKNEGLVLYPPFIALVTAGALWGLRRRGILSRRDVGTAVAWFAALALLFVLPWLAFKWSHGMSFGNGKPLPSSGFSWQSGVLFAIFVNTFFEGNWLLLPLLFLLLLVLRFRRAFSPPLLVLTSFIVLVYLAQIPIYLFTPLSAEVLYQTGYARGLIHLMPLVAMLTTMLLVPKAENR